MSFIDFILLLIIAGLCGAIGQAITGYSRGGCVVSIVVGFIGALIGGWIARELSLPEFFVVEAGTVTFPVIWSIIGSAIFVVVLSLFTRKR